MALLLAASVGTAIAVAQFVMEEPPVGTAGPAQEQSQEGKAIDLHCAERSVENAPQY